MNITICPHCKIRLSKYQYRRGNCPSCKGSWEVEGAQNPSSTIGPDSLDDAINENDTLDTAEFDGIPMPTDTQAESDLPVAAGSESTSDSGTISGDEILDDHAPIDDEKSTEDTVDSDDLAGMNLTSEEDTPKVDPSQQTVQEDDVSQTITAEDDTTDLGAPKQVENKVVYPESDNADDPNNLETMVTPVDLENEVASVSNEDVQGYPETINSDNADSSVLDSGELALEPPSSADDSDFADSVSPDDIGSFQETIDSGNLDPAVLGAASDQNESVSPDDIGSFQETIDSGNIDPSVIAAASGKNDSVSPDDIGSAQETIDSGNIDPSVLDSGDEEALNAPTLDGSVNPDDFGSYSETIDSGNIDPALLNPNDSNGDLGIEGDGADSGLELETMDSSQIDSSALPKPKRDSSKVGDGTSSQADPSSQTMDSSALKTADSNIGSSKLPHTGSKSMQNDSADSSMVKKLWNNVADSNVNPMMSLKGQAIKLGEERKLKIRKRSLEMEEGETESWEYKHVKFIAAGGMGEVHEATQGSIDRSVAIKMMKADFAHKQSERVKFLDEAAITGKLAHPNIVPIYDLGVSDAGTLFYSMKKVDGVPWNKKITEFSREENLEIFDRVCNAMAFAHSNNVIHRDLKPENVMLGDYGEVLVMDWGLAFERKNRDKIVLAGTPAYMSPEMAKHKKDQIGTKSDIYLLGAILFEICVGKAPHPGATIATCVRAAMKNEVHKFDQKDKLVKIALRAMATHPKHRFAKVEDLQKAVKDYEKHRESERLTGSAEGSLDSAMKNQDYDSYAQALFGFREAIQIWPENEIAIEGEQRTKLAYAETALEKQNFELGESLLSADNELEKDLVEKLRAGAKERDDRVSRIKLLWRSALAILVVGLIGIAGFAGFAEVQRRSATQAKNDAVKAQKNEAKQRKAAEDQKIKAEKARDDAKVAQKETEEANEKLSESIETEKAAKMAANEAEKEARAAEKLATDERIKAEKARDDEKIAKKEAEDAAKLAAKEADKARTAEKLANNEKIKAEKARDDAKTAEKAAEDAAILAAKEAKNARAAEKLANNEKIKAEKARDAEFKQTELARIGRYESAMNSIQSRMDSNPSAAISQDLNQLIFKAGDARRDNPEIRSLTEKADWEWARLYHRTHQYGKSSQPLGEQFEKEGQVTSFSASPNGIGALAVRTYSAAADNFIQLFQLSDGKPVGKISLGTESSVRTMKFSPDGKALVYGTNQNNVATISAFDIESKKTTEITAGSGLQKFTYVQDLAFSPDGKMIAVSGKAELNLYLRIWDTANLANAKVSMNGFGTGKAKISFASKVTDISFSADSSRMLAISFDNNYYGRCDVFDVSEFSNGNVDTIASIAGGYQNRIQSAVFTGKSNDKVVCGGISGDVFQWNVDQGQFVSTDSQQQSSNVAPKYFDGRHADRVRSLQFIDGSQLLSASDDQTVRLWDTIKQESSKVFVGHVSNIVGVQTLDTNGSFVTASRNGTLRFWDKSSNQDVVEIELPGGKSKLTASVVLPQKRLVIAGDSEGVLRWKSFADGNSDGDTFQIPDYEETQSVQFETDVLNSGISRKDVFTHYVPSNGVVVIYTVDGNFQTWDAETEELIDSAKLTEKNRVFAISKSGRYIFVGGKVKTDKKTGKRVEVVAPIFMDRSIARQDGTLSFAAGEKISTKLEKEMLLSTSSIAISHDEKYAAFVDYGQKIFIYDLEKRELALKPFTDRNGSFDFVEFLPDYSIVCMRNGDALRRYRIDFATGKLIPAKYIAQEIQVVGYHAEKDATYCVTSVDTIDPATSKTKSKLQYWKFDRESLAALDSSQAMTPVLETSIEALSKSTLDGLKSLPQTDLAASFETPKSISRIVTIVPNKVILLRDSQGQLLPWQLDSSLDMTKYLTFEETRFAKGQSKTARKKRSIELLDDVELIANNGFVSLIKPKAASKFSILSPGAVEQILASPDEQYIATINNSSELGGKLLQVWRTDDVAKNGSEARSVYRKTGNISSVVFGDDQFLFILADEGETSVQRIVLKDGKATSSKIGDIKNPTSLGRNLDTAQFFVANTAGELHLLDSMTGKTDKIKLAQIKTEKDLEVESDFLLTDVFGKDKVDQVKISSQGFLVLTRKYGIGSSDRAGTKAIVCRFDAKSNKAINVDWPDSENGRAISSIGFSANGRRLLTGRMDGEIDLWLLADSTIRRVHVLKYSTNKDKNDVLVSKPVVQQDPIVSSDFIEIRSKTDPSKIEQRFAITAQESGRVTMWLTDNEVWNILEAAKRELKTVQDAESKVSPKPAAAPE